MRKGNRECSRPWILTQRRIAKRAPSRLNWMWIYSPWKTMLPLDCHKKQIYTFHILSFLFWFFVVFFPFKIISPPFKLSVLIFYNLLRYLFYLHIVFNIGSIHYRKTFWVLIFYAPFANLTSQRCTVTLALCVSIVRVCRNVEMSSMNEEMSFSDICICER